MGEDIVFQQDNASIHTAGHTRQFLRERNIPLLDWPACSPDLNPIENLWGWLARRVYSNGKQFANVNDLKSAIRVAWGQIPIDYLKTPINV